MTARPGPGGLGQDERISLDKRKALIALVFAVLLARADMSRLGT